jgi:ribA/ribD-fused uncharacterized protein
MLCIATTKEGKACSRKAKIEEYCTQHSKIQIKLNDEPIKLISEVDIKVDSELETKTIDFYHISEKPYGVFSNYYLRNITVDDIICKSSEHGYQADKFTDPEYRMSIHLANTANKARELAKLKIANGYQWRLDLNPTIQKALDRGVKCRDDWANIKDQIMYKYVKAKFTQHADLQKILLSTGDKIIREASPRDSYWGIAVDKNGNPGLNKLGLLLMKVRDEIKLSQT